MISETNFKALNEIVTDEIELNKILGIIENEAKKQAKLIVKSDKVKAKAKAEEKKQAKLIAKAEKEAEALQIEAFKKNAEMFTDNEMENEFTNILMVVCYPKATKYYFDNVAEYGFNKVRTIKYNAIKDNETTEEVKEFVRLFKRMNKVKQFLMIRKMEANLQMDLDYAKNIKSMRSNKIDELIGEMLLQY